MHGVVTPNMLAATIGRPAAAAGRGALVTIPATAAAALARMRVEMRLSPAMSVTLGISTRSVSRM